MDAALCRPLRVVNWLSLIARSSFGPHYRDNRREPILAGLADKRGHWFCSWFDNGDGGD